MDSSSTPLTTMVLYAITAAIVSWLAMSLALPLFASSDRVALSSTDVLWQEGYWPNCEECIKLGTSRPSRLKRTQANAGCPQWKINAGWAGRQAFSMKLRDIESTAKDWEQWLSDQDYDKLREMDTDIITPPVFIKRERGVAWSRMEENVIAGNSEFHSSHPDEQGRKICWTDALLPLYVDNYGVEPSKIFQDFVSTFNLDSFRAKLESLRATGAKTE